MRTVVHVNQHVIRSNVKRGDNSPPITVRSYKSTQQCHRLVILGLDGRPAAEVIHSPEKPLSCGARVWIEVKGDVEVVKEG